MAAAAEIHRIDDSDFSEFVYRQGWTDGLPVFPPTRSAVAALVEYLGRDPQEVVGTIFPGDGVATIEKIAANCVMAGCRPEYFPVVMAVVEALTDPELPINTTQSTGAATIFTLVSGTIVRELGFHTREWIFGPNGGRANATIGRAIRLILWNIGRAHPGELIKGTMGHAAAWTYCIGEEQELTPWQPAHVDAGIAAEDSAVTVLKAGEHLQLAVPVNTVGVNESITLLARGIGRVGVSSSGGKRAFVFVINPSLAREIAQAGYTRLQLREAIAERARKYSYDWQNDKQQGEQVEIGDLYASAPSERKTYAARITPEEIVIAVGGGDAAQMGQCVSISSRSSVKRPLVTKKIRIPGK